MSSYLVLAMRYKEMFDGSGSSGAGGDVPFEIDGYLTEIDTAKIDSDYMNSRFDKYLKQLEQPGVDATELQKMLDDLHGSFAVLSQEEQKYANIFLRDVQRGTVTVEQGKTFRDYVVAYQFKAKNAQIDTLVQILGLDRSKLMRLMSANVTEATLNEFGRFDEVKNSVDEAKAKEYFEKAVRSSLPTFKVKIRIHELLRDFILKGGFDIE